MSCSGQRIPTPHTPAVHHSRLSQKPRPKGHPFQANIDSLKEILNKAAADQGSAYFRLPTTRSGPLPSPQLAHTWTLDHETPPFLAPWIVTGLRFLPQDALPLLLDLPIVDGLARAGARGQADRIERENLDFFERVRDAYRARAVVEPARFRVIDASRPLDAVRAAACTVIDAFIDAQVHA